MAVGVAGFVIKRKNAYREDVCPQAKTDNAIFIDEF